MQKAQVFNIFIKSVKLKLSACLCVCVLVCMCKFGINWLTFEKVCVLVFITDKILVFGVIT